MNLDNFHEVQERIDDVERIEMVLRRREKRRKMYLHRSNPFYKYTENEFRKVYRMSKAVARGVIRIVENDLHIPETRKGIPISVEIQVMATIRYFAKGAYQQDVADLHGFSQKTLSRIVHNVVRALARHRNEYVRFSQTAQEIRVIKEGFFRVARMPGIVGAIDCTHIRIKNPGGDNAAVYVNRKNFFSLNVQVIRDSQCRILDIVAKWRGRAHDSRIWESCAIREQFQRGEIRGILVGDGGYTATPTMLTLLPNPVTQSERRYNRAHIHTRNCVERLFGQWKGKFRCLSRGINTSLPTTKATIVALAVLHNICLEDFLLDEDIEEEDHEEEDISSDDEENRIPDIGQNLRGRAFRT